MPASKVHSVQSPEVSVAGKAPRALANRSESYESAKSCLSPGVGKLGKRSRSAASPDASPNRKIPIQVSPLEDPTVSCPTEAAGEPHADSSLGTLGIYRSKAVSAYAVGIRCFSLSDDQSKLAIAREDGSVSLYAVVWPSSATRGRKYLHLTPLATTGGRNTSEAAQSYHTVTPTRVVFLFAGSVLAVSYLSGQIAFFDASGTAQSRGPASINGGYLFPLALWERSGGAIWDMVKAPTLTGGESASREVLMCAISDGTVQQLGVTRREQSCTPSGSTPCTVLTYSVELLLVIPKIIGSNRALCVITYTHSDGTAVVVGDDLGNVASWLCSASEEDVDGEGGFSTLKRQKYKQLWVARLPRGAYPRCLIHVTTPNTIAAGTSNGDVIMLSGTTGEIMNVFTQHRGAVTAIVTGAAETGDCVYAAGCDDSLCCFRFIKSSAEEGGGGTWQPAEVKRRTHYHEVAALALAKAPVGNATFLLSASRDGTVMVLPTTQQSNTIKANGYRGRGKVSHNTLSGIAKYVCTSPQSYTYSPLSRLLFASAGTQLEVYRNNASVETKSMTNASGSAVWSPVLCYEYASSTTSMSAETVNSDGSYSLFEQNTTEKGDVEGLIAHARSNTFLIEKIFVNHSGSYLVLVSAARLSVLRIVLVPGKRPLVLKLFDTAEMPRVMSVCFGSGTSPLADNSVTNTSRKHPHEDVYILHAGGVSHIAIDGNGATCVSVPPPAGGLASAETNHAILRTKASGAIETCRPSFDSMAILLAPTNASNKHRAYLAAASSCPNAEGIVVAIPLNVDGSVDVLSGDSSSPWKALSRLPVTDTLLPFGLAVLKGSYLDISELLASTASAVFGDSKVPATSLEHDAARFALPQSLPYDVHFFARVTLRDSTLPPQACFLGAAQFGLLLACRSGWWYLTFVDSAETEEGREGRMSGSGREVASVRSANTALFGPRETYLCGFNTGSDANEVVVLQRDIEGEVQSLPLMWRIRRFGN